MIQGSSTPAGATQPNVPQMLNRNARYSVVKLAMLCGPITRRGSVSPALTWPKRGETPLRLDMIQSCRSRSIPVSSLSVHRLTSPSWLSYRPRLVASERRYLIAVERSRATRAPCWLTWTVSPRENIVGPANFVSVTV